MMPYDGTPGRYNLCVSHVVRRKLVRATNGVFRKCRPRIFVPRNKKDENSTGLWLAPGAELVACRTDYRLGIFNAAFLTVVGLGESSVLLRDDDSLVEFDLPLSQVQTTVRGRGGLTYHTAQGRTLEGRIVLWGMSSLHLPEKHIRIVVSRGRRFELLSADP